MNQFRDNLFSANHRMAMQTEYGFTEAEFIKIEELENDYREYNE